MRRISALTILALTCALAIGGTARAATYSTIVGIGDQHPEIFTNRYFKSLKVKKVRYFIPWDAAKHPYQLSLADAYVKAANDAGAEVLMHISTNDLRNKVGKLPSTAQYKTWVGRLIKRYEPLGVTEWGVWNEENHQSEETWNHPQAAVNFFLTMRSICKGCTIVGLDVLDQEGVNHYIDRFFTALGKKNWSKVGIVGIHNYSDTNRYRSTGTSLILKTVRKYDKKASFWLTETGGVASFGKSFPCNTTRQAKATKYMFSLAKKFHSDVKRIYNYAFFGTALSDCKAGSFDAGLVSYDGKHTRSAYTSFKAQAKSFSR
ncbi:MAG TPA: glycosyl hydrolase [Solirubrobacteraceae bacterium]|jgi:hypothetical protein|nr:glycosyl hydrolase [Solirubrobacteraceae bacterium]